MKEKLKKFIKNPFVQMIAVLGLLALVPSMLSGALRGDNWFGKIIYHRKHMEEKARLELIESPLPSLSEDSLDKLFDALKLQEGTNFAPPIVSPRNVLEKKTLRDWTIFYPERAERNLKEYKVADDFEDYRYYIKTGEGLTEDGFIKRYCVHEGGYQERTRYVCFFYPYTDEKGDTYLVEAVYYLDYYKNEEDFSELTVGASSYSDVKNVDGSLILMPDKSCSYHLLGNGDIMQISYDICGSEPEDLIVSGIEMIKRENAPDIAFAMIWEYHLAVK